MQKWSARAFGKGAQLANTKLEELKATSMTCADVLAAAAKIIHKVHEEGKDMELEMAWITEKNGFVYEKVPDDLVAAAETKAKAELDQEEDD